MEKEDCIVNNHGLRIMKCCASCEFKEYTGSDGFRHCKLHDVHVRPSDLCESFAILPSCMDEGAGKGVVRKKHFIDYLTDKLSEPDVPGVRKPTPFSIEKEYKEKFGNPNVF